MNSENITDLNPDSELPQGKAVLFFWASWHEPTAPKGSTDMLFRTLASSSTLPFFRVEAEEVPELSEKYNVTVVPSFVLLGADGSVVKLIEGVDNVSQLTQAVAALQSQSSDSNVVGKDTTDTAIVSSEEEKSNLTNEEKLNQRLKDLIESSQVMLFMKGSPTAPKCGFSRQIVELLSESKISFGSFDILQDDEVRQGLKTYSDWPTYPQLYARGELLGGLDIIKEMAEDSEGLAAQLDVEPIKIDEDANPSQEEPLDDRLKKLINRSKVMLFMKGLPAGPKCGFSRQICEILNELDDGKISYDAFDILQDEDVRQGLKTYSDWPTFPQLYVNGELLGGLDIVKEMAEEGDLIELIKG